jgi:hypothetical protein
MDELHRIFTTYEMRTRKENPGVKETSFKESKRSNQKEKEHNNRNDISEDDEEMANFVRRLNKGSNDRY